MDELIRRIWQELTFSKYKSIYTFNFNARLRRRENRIKWFMAFSSSSGVAGWLLWEQVPWLWPLIIILSQIINLSTPFIFQFRNSKLWGDLQWYYEKKHFEFDNLWLDITLGKHTQEELAAVYSDLNAKYFEDSQRFQSLKLKEDERLRQESELTFNNYIKAKYNV